tara:strand:- start:5946 stop:7382 length:1437 start_codon:yes stop_codon:yes gene_type:complete
MANGRIIEAARAAFTTPKIDISGYVEGLAAIGQGLAIKNKRANAKKNAVKGYKPSSNLTDYKNLFKSVKQDILDGNISYEDGVAKLENINLAAKEILPKIQQTLMALHEEGFSGGVDSQMENYALSWISGELNPKVTVTNKTTGSEKTMDSLFIIDPDSLELKVLGPSGDFEKPEEVLSKLVSLTRSTDGKGAADLTASYITTDYKTEDQWRNNSNGYKTKILNEFKDENKKISFLLDNDFYIDDKKVTFREYYLKNHAGINFEDIKNKDEKTLNLLAKQLMESDTNLNNDVESFLTQIINSKKPRTATSSTDKIDNILLKNSQISEIDKMFKSTKQEDTYRTLVGGYYVGPSPNDPMKRVIFDSSGKPAVQIQFDPYNISSVKNAMREFYTMLAGKKQIGVSNQALNDFRTYIDNITAQDFIFTRDDLPKSSRVQALIDVNNAPQANKDFNKPNTTSAKDRTSGFDFNNTSGFDFID